MWGDEQTALPANLIISLYSLSEDLAMTKSRMFVLISALSASFLASPVVSAASDGVMMKDGKMKMSAKKGMKMEGMKKEGMEGGMGMKMEGMGK